MRRLFLILLIFIPFFGATQVYKWVDENGRVHYSDQPRAGAESVTLEAGNTITLPTPSQPAPKPKAETGPQYRIGLPSPAEGAVYGSGSARA